MFKDIVSALSLSPHAVSQLTFYARRLAKERVSRVFSAIGAVLIIGLQFSTIAAPPVNVNAASPSDIIYGGYVSKDDLLNKYDASSELQALYNYFGISRQDVVNAQKTTINTRDRSLNSLGRVQHGDTDQAVQVGGTTYWARYLYSFDTGSNVQYGSDYDVLQGTTTSGKYFAIMFRCGNLVFRELPQPTPAPTPTPTPTPPPTPAPTATPVKPTLACVKLTGNVASGMPPLAVSFTGEGAATNQTITAYTFNFGDKTAPQTGPAKTANHTYANAGTYTATLTVTGSLGTTTAVSAPCSYKVTVTPLPAAFTKSKSALNQTQNVDATTKPANPGDKIQYTLTTTNTGGTAQSYTVVEHLEDVLEYATVEDSGNGAMSSAGVMTWPAAVIEPGKSLTQTFVVAVKNPVPNTPTGVSDPFSYDLRMDNVYGNAVQIQIAPPLPKQVETAAAQLPATGPGAGVTFVLVFCALALFFYFRNRQLAAEIRLLRHDYNGGM